MSDASLKTYTLSGNLNQKGILSTDICEENTNISVGLWNVCISSICINCQDQNGQFCAISSNLVKHKQLNKVSKVLENVNPSISNVFLKGRKIVYLDKTWFTINNQCSEIKLFFSNMENTELLLIDCELYVTVLFQRVK
jgi:hypothetical protein